jgi:hypothetical protein
MKLAQLSGPLHLRRVFTCAKTINLTLGSSLLYIFDDLTRTILHRLQPCLESCRLGRNVLWLS